MNPEQLTTTFGGAWVGEQALGLSLYRALVAEDFVDGLRLVINHSGDSDSTGSITGNLLGVLGGEPRLRPDWLAALEGREVIERLTTCGPSSSSLLRTTGAVRRPSGGSAIRDGEVMRVDRPPPGNVVRRSQDPSPRRSLGHRRRSGQRAP